MSNSTTSSSLVLTLTAIQFRMSTIVMPILLIFGSGGNILNAMIFLQKTFRSNSCSIYMIAGYLLHTLVLCWAMSTNLYSLYNRDPLTYNESYCKIRQYSISAIFTMARLCVGMACVDRFAISSQNANIRAFGRPRTARSVIIIIIVICLIAPIHLLIFNTIQNGRCLMPGLYPYFFATYAIIIAAVIPPSIMVTFSILAAKNIQHIRQRIQPLPVSPNPVSETNRVINRNARVHLRRYDYQLLKMLLVDVTIYCISAVPSPIYYIYAAVTLKLTKTPEQVAWQNFLNYLAYQVLLYIAASTSLYTNLWVSKVFRNEFKLFINRFIFTRRERIINNTTRINTNSKQPNHIPLRNYPNIAITQQRSNVRQLRYDH